MKLYIFYEITIIPKRGIVHSNGKIFYMSPPQSTFSY